jgi:hypothetical protein
MHSSGLFIYNIPGLVVVALAFGIAIGAGWVTGVQDEGRLTLIGGVLTLAFDMAYRLLKKGGDLLTGSKGGSLFFLPAWGFGVFWIVLGIFYMMC